MASSSQTVNVYHFGSVISDWAWPTGLDLHGMIHVDPRLIRLAIYHQVIITWLVVDLPLVGNILLILMVNINGYYIANDGE